MSAFVDVINSELSELNGIVNDFLEGIELGDIEGSVEEFQEDIGEFRDGFRETVSDFFFSQFDFGGFDKYGGTPDGLRDFGDYPVDEGADPSPKDPSFKDLDIDQINLLLGNLGIDGEIAIDPITGKVIFDDDSDYSTEDDDDKYEFM